MHVDYVLLFIVDPGGRFLLQHRDDTAPTYPGYWGFFGGAIEPGETPLEALRRETYEELMYRPSVDSPSLITDYDDKVTNCSGTKYYFIETWKEMPRVTLLEGQGMDWYSLEQLDTILLSDYNRQKILALTTLTRPAL